MQKIHILFSNQSILNAKAIKVISEKYNLFIFNLDEELRKQIKGNEDELVIRIKSFIDNANLIPNQLIEAFIKTNIERQNQNTLLIEFPKTAEQLNMLSDLELEIETIWYINQKNAEEYMLRYFKNPNAKKWLDKYGEEVHENWIREFEKKQLFISEIQKITENRIWKIIEVDYDTEMDEELITKKINDFA